ncbi:MAG: hypothetical protein Q9226_009048 [Calogaya cf. arnoldii]
MDNRLPPWEKRKPPGFPSFDPMNFILPLFDAYAGPGRVRDIKDARLHPTLAPFHDLPSNMLFVIPTIDFLMYEQLEMVERLQAEAAEEDKKKMPDEATRRIEKMVFEGQWHGWLECTFPIHKHHLNPQLRRRALVPSWAIDESTRQKAFTAACDFLTDVYRKHGFDISQRGSDMHKSR